VEDHFEKKEEEQLQQQQQQQKSLQHTLASEITNPHALPSVFFSRPQKGHTVRQI